jgi:hypothetical protein
MGVRLRYAVIVPALVLVVALSACGGDSTTTELDEAPSIEPRVAQTVTLEGIVVTVETTPGLAPDAPGGGTAPYEPEPSAPGRVRFTIHATAVNSTEATIPVRISHNYPTVRDASGTYLELVDAWLTAGPSDSKFSPQGEALGPGGVLETMQTFDVDSGQRDLRLEWDFYERGVATFVVQPPRSDACLTSASSRTPSGTLIPKRSASAEAPRR